MEEEQKIELLTLKCKNFGKTLWSSNIFKNWRTKRGFLCLMFVFSNFLTNFDVQSPYLFLNTSAMENIDENLVQIYYY